MKLRIALSALIVALVSQWPMHSQAQVMPLVPVRFILDTYPGAAIPPKNDSFGIQLMVGAGAARQSASLSFSFCTANNRKVKVKGCIHHQHPSLITQRAYIVDIYLPINTFSILSKSRGARPLRAPRGRGPQPRVG
jgi:hypothetical protein